jgi:hypothetical protein
VFRVGWRDEHRREAIIINPATGEREYEMAQVQITRNRRYQNVPGLWQQLQSITLLVFSQLHMLSKLDMPAAAAAAVTLVHRAASSSEEAAAGSSSSSSGGGGSGGSAGSSAAALESEGSVGHVKWDYLLQLQQSSTWAEAAAAFGSKWPDLQSYLTSITARMQDGSSSSGASSAGSDSPADATSAGSIMCSVTEEQVRSDQLYADALARCRELVAAAPLPLVCNNPSCENLAGASETSVAVKVCAGCRCRYCSAACQAADWRRHKRGCKHMVACGIVCGR